ncbi:MAG: hypothetical protein AB7S26_36515 [Sandaracinaceae bacterium]
MNAPLLRWVCAGALVALGTGCAPGLDDPDRFRNIDCNYDVPRDLLAVRCGRSDCHSALNPAAGMDLVSGGVEERLAGVEATTCPGHSRIDTADPDSSFILERISEEPDCDGAEITRMPADGTPLSEDEVMCLTQWLNGVAMRHAGRVPSTRDAGAGGGSDAGAGSDAGDADGGAGDGG